MKSKMSLISIAISLSVGLIISMTVYAHGDNAHTGTRSDNSTHSSILMKGGMGMSGMNDKGMGEMMDRCKTMMKDHAPQSSTTATKTFY